MAHHRPCEIVLADIPEAVDMTGMDKSSMIFVATKVFEACSDAKQLNGSPSNPPMDLDKNLYNL